MPLSKNIWLEDDERRRQVEPAPAPRDEAFFGLNASRPAKRPAGAESLQLGGAVYDFMNTLLSFGSIMPGSAPACAAGSAAGERVLDVCGDGDLAILAARRVGPGAGSSSTTSTAP